MRYGPKTLRTLITIAVTLLLLASVWFGLMVVLHRHSECRRLSSSQILAALPSGAVQYDLSTNGYSPKACYYAVDAFVGPANPPNASKPTGTVLPDPVLGTWIINTRNLTARRISLPSDYANVFDRWVSDDGVRLKSDDGDVSAIYGVNKSAIVSRNVDDLLLRFVGLSSDVHIMPQVLSNSHVDSTCGSALETNQGFVLYPMACLRSSSVMLAVPTYKTFLLKYGDPLTVYVNGHAYQLSNTHGVEIDL